MHETSAQLRQSLIHRPFARRLLPEESAPTRFVPAPYARYRRHDIPFAPARQVSVVPIGIDRLEAHDTYAGHVSVHERETGAAVRAHLYRRIDLATSMEIYRLVPAEPSRNRVIGFLKLRVPETSQEKVFFSLVGNLDPRYSGIGKAAHAVAIERMKQAGACGIYLKAAWGASESHLLMYGANRVEIHPFPNMRLGGSFAVDAVNAALERSARDGSPASYHDCAFQDDDPGQLVMFVPEEAARRLDAEIEYGQGPVVLSPDAFDIEPLRGSRVVGNARVALVEKDRDGKVVGTKGYVLAACRA